MPVSYLRAADSSGPPMVSPPWADLPGPALIAILNQCDEPTRYSASQACKALAEAVPQARRADYEAAAKTPGRWTQEILPTATELADRGCLRPNWENIAKTMRMPTNVGRGTLSRFYVRAARLADAQKAGCTFAVNIDSGCYIGGGVGQKPDGHGVMTWADGARYEGGWKAGQKDGHGVISWADGERYEGGWKVGQKDGHGVYTWADGRRYEGGYKADKKDGHGVMTWAGGDRYDGGWKAGKKDGHGVMTWAGGDRYEGGWKEDKKDGHGVMVCAGGDRYEGSWKEGKEVASVVSSPTPASMNQTLVARFFARFKL